MRTALPRTSYLALGLLLGLLTAVSTLAQPGDRIRFNDQELWLSGGNVAWINFAADIGPGTTNLDAFREAFEDVRRNGGNAMRLWLHTNGTRTPEWDGSTVVGPGEGAIDDLRDILDVAWENNVGLLLCLWSHDMLNMEQNPTVVLSRNEALLRSTASTQAYIDSALVPMVSALAGHPAIIAWEIFNEPEGISNEHGWSTTRHVPMSNIQRFVNMAAGAIHRTDSTAQVTNGAWAFISTSDVTQTTHSKSASLLTDSELDLIRTDLSRKYRHAYSTSDAVAFYDGLHSATNYNYYRDDRLIAAGGDPDGTLDWYTVHYYTWAGTALSPFHHSYQDWGLDKPMALGEFFLPTSTFGVPADSLYKNLYDNGYAGALAWQWWDWWTERVPEQVNWPRARRNMRLIQSLYAADVTIDRGLFIARFEAEPPGIEAGQTSTLYWTVYGSTSLELNGVEVDSIGSHDVMPTADTTFTLIASDSEGNTDTARVTIEVLDPSQVNRARRRPVVASSGEPGSPEIDPNRAVDGDPNTRWSSAWQDDEWIYVDLGDAFELDVVRLVWEVAYGASYNIDVSLDGIFWTTVHEERSGDGETDEIEFANGGPIARFVRMHGLERGTQWGFSLWEFEVYGLLSTFRPPSISLTRPYEGALIQPGTDLEIVAEAGDEDGEVTEVRFYLGDSLLGTITRPPYELTVTETPEGTSRLSAVAIDNDELAVSTPIQPLYVVDASGFTRYEFEEADYEGDISVETLPRFKYLYVRDSGTITFDSVFADRSGDFDLIIRYQLPFGFKAQYLDVNDDPTVEVGFDGPLETWQSRGVTVRLEAGFNTLTIEKFWGWMYFDYLAVDAPRYVVGLADEPVPEIFSVSQNFPNPFVASTSIPYKLVRPSHVTIEIFSLTGRHVATLVDATQPAGFYTVEFDASGLAAGMYMYRVTADSRIHVGRMTRTH